MKKKEIKERKAVDFGFDTMQYEDTTLVHSTNLVWNLNKQHCNNLTLRELVLATRISSNSRKSLTLNKCTDNQEIETVRLNFIKRL